MNKYIYIQYFLLFINLIATLYLIFFKDYLKKKGSNLADKEDISEITEKIELVKNIFTKESEILKKDLQVVANKEIRNFNEERNAILNFFDAHTNWIESGIIHLSILVYNRENTIDLKNKIVEINGLYTKCSTMYSHLTLMVNSTELIADGGELLTTSLKFSQWHNAELIKLENCLNSNKRFFDAFHIEFDKSTTSELTAYFAKKEKESKDEMYEIRGNYLNEINSKYEPTMKFKAVFTQLVKKYFNENRIS